MLNLVLGTNLGDVHDSAKFFGKESFQAKIAKNDQKRSL